MTRGKHRARPPAEDAEAPWALTETDETEPDWAEEIRQGRRERGEHLKEVFAAFEEGERDDGADGGPPRKA